MKYREYLKCAHKHLRSCKLLLDAYTPGSNYDLFVWLDLYYLSGYVIEGIVVYSAYKSYGWEESRDIQYDYDVEFSKLTGLDFYDKRWVPDEDSEAYRYFSKRSGSDVKSVHSHKFQLIVYDLLHKIPSFNGIPYIGDGCIDEDIKQLIDDWSPKVRYEYEYKKANNHFLSKDIIVGLIDTCCEIYNKTYLI